MESVSSKVWKPGSVLEVVRASGTPFNKGSLVVLSHCEVTPVGGKREDFLVYIEREGDSPRGPYSSSRFQLYEPVASAPTPKKIASDGGATGYYDIPEGSVTLYDLIEHKNMNFSEGNVFKAIYRMGDKEGIDPLYDWRKIKFCAEREIARLEKLQCKTST